ADVEEADPAVAEVPAQDRLPGLEPHRSVRPTDVRDQLRFVFGVGYGSVGAGEAAYRHAVRVGLRLAVDANGRPRYLRPARRRRGDRIVHSGHFDGAVEPARQCLVVQRLLVGLERGADGTEHVGYRYRRLRAVEAPHQHDVAGGQIAWAHLDAYRIALEL